MSILSCCFYKVFIFLHIIILTPSTKIKSKLVRNNGNEYCADSLNGQEGYDKDWTIISDAFGQSHRVDLIIDYSTFDDYNKPEGGDWVKFYLFTKKNVDAPEEIFKGNKSKFFMPEKPLKILSHGWTGDKEAMADIRDAYLKCSDVNVVVIDWSLRAKAPYFVACASVVEAGIQVGSMARYLMTEYNFSASNIDLVGHSLGAHVMGAAGRGIHSLTYGSEKISRIFGLDPARPYFELFPIFKGLSKEDAAFVEVVHTNAGVNGVKAAYGHVDFYANGGGMVQPGCFNMTYTYSCIDSMYCSHHRSVLFFAESLVTGGFTSTICDSYEDYEKGLCIRNDKQPFGEKCSRLAKGNYYFDTNASPPFSK